MMKVLRYALMGMSWGLAVCGWTGVAQASFALPDTVGTVTGVDPSGHTVDIGSLHCHVPANATIRGVSAQGKAGLSDLYPGLKVRYAVTRVPKQGCVVRSLWVLRPGKE